MKDSFDKSARSGPSVLVTDQVSHATVQRHVREERKRSQDAPVALFRETLAETFEDDTVAAILSAFEHLQLPLPEHNVEFIRAYEGAIFCSNDYGMVVRVEPIDEKIKMNNGAPPHVERIDDNPWILQPLGSVVAGDVIIEICPGVHTTDKTRDLDVLHDGLRRTGANFYDLSCTNAGRLPFVTSEFPDGVPVVIDRLAVKRLTASTRNIARALQTMKVGISPQRTLYSGLKRKFRRAWPKGATAPDPARMQEFWRAMREAKSKGLLVAGWNEKIDDTYKIVDARISATAYDQRLRKHFKSAAAKETPTTGANLRTSSAPKPRKK